MLLPGSLAVLKGGDEHDSVARYARAQHQRVLLLLLAGGGVNAMTVRECNGAVSFNQ
jgi:hypothetical protein